ncbi:RNA methyltransferase [Bacteroidales bacterium OttesenSCG-928-A17]|nr:RNA methyltransferase [Bacteroidales bacterium OttesenSCG-928-A17]
MLGKNKIKFIHSLEKKKFRSESGCFLAEGNKLVADILPVFECELLVAQASWLATQGDIQAKELLVVDEDDIRKASLLKNPQEVIAVFRQPQYKLEESDLNEKLNLILDGVQDPGNLGTIIRIADWFGITDIICSPDSADVYNPKVVQATMGAIAGVRVHYLELQPFLSNMKNIPVYGTFLDGDSIYQKELKQKGFIVMGNEGNGISPEIESLVTEKLYIPDFSVGERSAESLNVAVATAVTCSEFRRRTIG